ncbi:MAG: zf-TFIIB domain-containing protein [Agromyces sp.]|uniref:TFIIB-type zinc ribbon-containing protein n=1 Tax=Agromyces sp. NPDC056965 TaxID=3345983 RepID=UPI0036281B98
MQCPTDGTVLVMSERSGIEIDYCPTCRGVWLDRGELDKIVERAAREFSAPPQAASAPPAPPTQPQAPAYGQPSYQQPYDNRGYDRGYDNRGQGDYRKKKKESWLSELFD